MDDGAGGGRLQSYRSLEAPCATRGASSKAEILVATARAPGSQAMWLVSASALNPRFSYSSGMKFEACSHTIRQRPLPLRLCTSTMGFVPIYSFMRASDCPLPFRHHSRREMTVKAF